MPHNIDPLTFFCMDCGKSESNIIARSLDCIAAANVIAISHIVHYRRLEKIFEGIELMPKTPSQT